MNTKIICVGKLKEPYLRDAFAEYKKRLSRFTNMILTELPEYALPDSPSPAQINKAIDEESAAILRSVQKNDYVIALDICGKQLTSEELSELLQNKMLEGTSNIAFIIGGSNGYNDAVRSRANMRLSFSKLTFPHQLFRIMLTEQIYRAFKIAAGEKYHK